MERQDQRVVFLHGLESGPYGSKYEALKAPFSHVSAPDCTGVMDVQARLSILREHMGDEPAFLVGSSFGGLVAVLFEAQHPELVLGMVLCAPALHQGVFGAPESNTVVIHGTRDDVIPISSSRAYAKAHGITLIEVDDDHRLAASSDLLVAQTLRLTQ